MEKRNNLEYLDGNDYMKAETNNRSPYMANGKK